MSEQCQRFEREGLERLERGEVLGAHFQQCPDCLQAADGYQELAERIQAAPRREPPPDFEAKVWAKVARQEQRRKLRFALPAFATVAAAALVLTVWPHGTTAPSLTLSVQDAQTEAVRGTGAPKPGDVLVVRAASSGAHYSELRVYRDGALVMRCTGGPLCTRTEDVLEAKVPLDAIGHYEALLVYGKEPLAPLPERGTISEDLDRAMESGATVVTAAPVDVY